jgi:hypothetical protein
MRYLFFFSLVLLFCACKAQNCSNIKLTYVDLDIMTPIDVNCNDFETLFKSQIKTVIIINKTDIDSINFAFNKLEVDTSNYIPDVRVKLEINSSNKSKIYCLSKMGIYCNNISYILPDRLINKLKKYMK